jgi:hypothetical protein
MGSGFDGWVYWCFFTITLSCNGSHIELLLNDVFLTNLCEESRTPVWISNLSSDCSLLLELSLMLRLTVSRPVYLGIKHPSGAYDQIFISVRNTSDTYVLDSVGRPLWREDGSVFCMFRWPLPAQSSGPSPLGLATVFYCLRFETSLFVASYDSQGHGGGIRPRLYTGISLLEFTNALPFTTSTRPG